MVYGKIFVMSMNKTIGVLITIFIVLILGIWFAISSARTEAVPSKELNENRASGPSTITTPNVQENTMNTNDTEVTENPIVTLSTNKGDISIELFLDSAPLTAGNFLTLVESGFYTNTKFHRVIPGFMVQGGDPNSKTDDESTYGTGGPGYSIDDEFAQGLSNTTGTLSMANSGPNTGGSQFFINVADNTFLDGKHAVFGRVVSGMDTVTTIEGVETKERDIPREPVIITEVRVDAEESN